MGLDLWQVQTALRRVLIAHNPLAALVGERVHDAAPQTVLFPYVRIGPIQASDTSVDCFEDSFDATLDLHVWSRERGFKQTQAILAAVYGALHRVKPAPALPPPFKFISVSVDAQRCFLDADGLTTHGVSSVLVRVAS